MVILDTGNVGIGTTGPNVKLESAISAANETTSALRLTNLSAFGYGIGIDFADELSAGRVAARIASITPGDATTGDLYFQTRTASALTTKMYISTSGNVGIGTTSPQANLGLAGSIGVNSTQLVVAANGSVGVGTAAPATWGAFAVRRAVTDANGHSISGSFSDASNSTLSIGHASGVVKLISDAGLSFWTNATPAERVRIDSSGNVGIGTTGPGSKLTIVAPNQTIAADIGIATIYSNDSQAVDMGGSIALGGYYIGTSNLAEWASVSGRKENGTSGNYAGYLALSTRANGSDAAERVRITSAGNVGIGTTSPWRTLAVTGTFGISAPTNSNTGDYLCWNTTTKEVTESATACSLSSIRWKENVRELDYGLDEVLRLRPVLYDLKPQYGIAKDQPGFIAEEAEDVVPRLVSYDAQGLPTGFDYPKLTAVLVKAVQEQNIKLEDFATTTDTTTLLAASGYDGFAGASELVRSAVAGVADIADAGLKRLNTAIYAAVGMFDTLISERLTVTQADIEEARIARLETQELCVGSVCVLESDFLEVFGTTSETAVPSGSAEPEVGDTLSTDGNFGSGAADTETDTNGDAETGVSGTAASEEQSGGIETEESVQAESVPTEEPTVEEMVDAPVENADESVETPPEPTSSESIEVDSSQTSMP